MCNIANVSKSGFYKWVKSINKIKYKQDMLFVTAAFLLSNRKGGFRTIKMILKRNFGVIMNHKKIIKLMKMLNLKPNIRKPNPYKFNSKKLQDKCICKNLVQRNFKDRKPFEVISCDITYLRYAKTFAYLSVMIDVKTNEVISYCLSENLNSDFVQNTVVLGLEKIPKEYLSSLIVHSDRGIQYTSIFFQNILRNCGIQQSMSRPGTPLDNAVVESFFGHLKDEVNYKHCKTFRELSELIDRYMYNYNNARPQWNKYKMTPIEYRNYLLAS